MLYMLLVFELVFSAVETTYTVENFFPYFDYCSGEQNMVRVTDNITCTEIPCFADVNNTILTECHEDYMDAIRLNFSDEYIVQKVYTDFGCSTFSYAIVYRVTKTCESGFYESEGFRHLFHYKTMLEDDGTGTIAFYSTSDCSFLSSYSSYIVGDITTKHVTNNDDCTSDFSSDVFPGNYRWNTSNRNDIVLSDETSNQGDDGDTGGGGLSDEIFALILCAGILLVLGIVAFVISKSGRNQQQEPRENSLVVTVTLDSAMAANEILHYEQPDEAEGGVIFATLVETLQS